MSTQLPDVRFVIGQGGLGTPAPGQDYISGILVYNNNLPSGFSTTKRVIQFFSIEDAENAGILTDHADATAATGGGFTVTAVGSDGNTIEVTFAQPDGTIVSLGKYEKITADSTVTLVAAGIVGAINAGTGTHGFAAANTAGAITITAPKNLGVFPNTKTVTTTIVGTITVGTPTNFASGVASLYAIYHYHISEFFRINPTGNIYFGVYAVPAGTYDFSEVKTIQDFADGKIRQIAVYCPETTLTSAKVTSLQTILTALEVDRKPLIAILGADISATTNLATLPDLSQLTAKYVMVDIGQDGAAEGNDLFIIAKKSITTIGAALGAISAVDVGSSIAYPELVPLVSGEELDTAAFANGTPYKTVATGLLTTLNNYKYLFLRKYVGLTGTFFIRDNTCVAETSPYNRARLSRTLQKATRNLYTAMVPKLFKKLLVNEDGTLSQETIDEFTTTAEGALDPMLTAQEISARRVIINASQDVLGTNELVITVEIVPVGAAESIKINIGFVKSI